MQNNLNQVDQTITAVMAKYGPYALRLALGVIFLWFGALKFFPGMSTAELLATKTIESLSFGIIPPAVSRVLLASWESLIGLGLIFGVYLRATLLLLFLQMIGTFTPLILFPSECFVHIPLVPTLEGQYIIKNLVLVSGGMILGSMVRGGAIVADSAEANKALARQEQKQQ